MIVEGALTHIGPANPSPSSRLPPLALSQTHLSFDQGDEDLMPAGEDPVADDTIMEVDLPVLKHPSRRGNKGAPSIGRIQRMP